MILDRGICRIYRKTSITPPGGKPTSTLAEIHESYYAELGFETSPRRPTDSREETETAARVRILQNRLIHNQDVVALTPFDGNPAKTEKYRITRAYHGADDENGELITDLTLSLDEFSMTAAANSSGDPDQGTTSGSTSDTTEPAAGVSG